MKTRNRRFFMFLGTGLITAVAGALGGYAIGRATVINVAQTRLKAYAAGIIQRGETSSGESRQVLSRLLASPFPACSDAEISYFRDIIFRSEFLKDAGRLSAGSVVCTASLGRLEKPFPLPLMPLVQPDRTNVYLNLAAFSPGNVQLVSLQLQDAIVVFSPFILPSPDHGQMHYAMTVPNRNGHSATQVVGNLPKFELGYLGRDGDVRIDGVLYATRCSRKYFNCITAYMDVAEAVKADHVVAAGYSSLSALAGWLFGTAAVLVYSRNKTVKSQLRRALRHGQLKVAYQPIVDLKSSLVTGAEALIRWTGDDGLAVAPSMFVKVAEESGFIGLITKLVLQTGLRELAPLLNSQRDFCLNVNISAFDLSHAAIVGLFHDALKKANIPASRIGIELTESSTANRAVAVNTIQKLRALGHRVYIDDFGTGYSSLSYLHELAVDGIKIDQGFTRSIGTESVTVSILPQILAMASALKLLVVVEGIETERQAAYFRSVEQRVWVQGWLFAKPMTARELFRWMADGGTGDAAKLAVASE